MTEDTGRKIYIGIANDCLERWNKGEGYRNNPKMYEAIKSCGWENVKHEILTRCNTREEALRKEALFIVRFNSEDPNVGYNQSTLCQELDSISIRQSSPNWQADGIDIGGIKYCPCCGRRMKSKFLNVTVEEFIEASDFEDWINQTTESVYQIYWKWCIKKGYSPTNKIVFVKAILNEFPELKSSPCKGKRYFRKA